MVSAGSPACRTSVPMSAGRGRGPRERNPFTYMVAPGWWGGVFFISCFVNERKQSIYVRGNL